MTSAENTYDTLVWRLKDIESIIQLYRDILSKWKEEQEQRVRSRQFTKLELLKELNSYGDEFRKILALVRWYEEEGIVGGDYSLAIDILEYTAEVTN